MVRKVAYNSCYGGYSLTDEFVEWMREQGDEDAEKEAVAGEYYSDGSGPKDDHMPVYPLHIERTNELLVESIEGNTDFDGAIGGRNADLRVATVPDGVSWTIDEYDGVETVKEQSRTFS